MRGGYFWTRGVNQTVGAYIALAAIALGIHPIRLSILNAVLGITTSGLVVVLHPSSAIGAAIIGFFGWQLAYSIDCADGQAARSTGQTSPQGAVLDLLFDFLVQASVALAAMHLVAANSDNAVVSELSRFIVVGWLVGPFYSGIIGDVPSREARRKNAWPIALLRESRDYGLHIALLPVALVIGSAAVLAVAGIITLLHFGSILMRSYMWGIRRR